MLVNHHQPHAHGPYATTPLYWWNANLLFWMSLIPLSTAVFGEHPTGSLSVAFYGCDPVRELDQLRLRALVHRARALAAGRKLPLLIGKDAFFTLLYASSVPLAYVSVYASMAIFAICPAAYFVPDLGLANAARSRKPRSRRGERLKPRSPPPLGGGEQEGRHYFTPKRRRLRRGLKMMSPTPIPAPHMPMVWKVWR